MGIPVTLQVATPDDAPDMASLLNTTSQYLTQRYGVGHWSSGATENGLRAIMKRATAYVARDNDRLIAMLALSTRKPWAIDKTYFSPSRLPLYVTGMAVAPDLQGKGVGRLCIEEARRIASDWPSDALRLDAYDAPAGAGGFYRKCGFTEVGRATYRGTPLIYFEMLL